MCTPSITQIASLVSISKEAEGVCRLAECLDLLDDQIDILNKRSQDLQEYYIRELVVISEEHKRLLLQRTMIEEATSELTTRVLQRNNIPFNLNF